MSTLQLRARDGHTLSAYVVKPEGPPRGAIVVAQEIFGVNSHVRRVVEQYAAEGYLAIAPAMFDRFEKDVSLDYDDAGLEAGIALASRTTNETVLADLNAAIGAVAHAGRVGMVGYCWGGRATYLAACHADIAAGVAYYGSGIPQLLPDTPRCPMLFHYGERDAYIPLAEVEKVRRAHPGGIYHLYPAGHGFNCSERADFHPESARLAFDRTIAFFRQHVG
jgi:carboxymethylenebutenolidase